MIRIAPFDNAASLAVFRQLDRDDWSEAQLMRGGGADHLDLWGDWRAAHRVSVLSVVLHAEATDRPFAVLQLGHTGQAGVAQAALLSRNHNHFKAELRALARRLRREIPPFCRRAEIRRIEARSWTGHRNAAMFLKACGFRHEAEMAGFGGTTDASFHQFSWTHERT